MLGLLMAWGALSAGASPRALLVAPTEYDPEATGWVRLHGDRDVALVREGLHARGVPDENIEVLSGSVTSNDLRAALRDWAVQPGDDLYVHYSGHAQQLTDLDGDEVHDGLDEALALVDTPGIPSAAGRGYRGAQHVIDDELAGLLGGLRRRVGPTGSVVVVIDACHSGTAARDGVARGGPPLVLRGGKRPSGAPVRSLYADILAVGDTLAPVTVLSAAQSNQEAIELRMADGRLAGALSVVVSEVLGNEPGITTWRAVHERVLERSRRRGLAQVPQIEGAIDAALFGADVAAGPAHGPLLAHRGRNASIGIGRLRGLVPGSRVEVHAPGALRPTEATRWATATVTRSEGLQASVTLDRSLPAETDGARVFVVQLAPSDLQLEVGLSGPAAALVGWRRELEGTPLLRESVAPDIVVQVTPDGVSLTRPQGLVVAEQPGASGPTPSLLRQLRRLSGAKLVEAVRLKGDGGIRLTVQPARWTRGRPSRLGCEPLARGGSGVLHVHDGDAIRVTVERVGSPAHLTMVAIDGRGLGSVVFPAPGESWDTPRRGVVFDECLRVSRDAGFPADRPSVETLRVLATSGDPRTIDVRELLRADGRDAAPPERLGQSGASGSVTYVIEPE